MSTTQNSSFRIVLFFLLFISSSSFASGKKEFIEKIDYNVLFEVAKHDVSIAELSRFKVFYESTLKNSPRITLTGHTDSDGSNSYNQELSQARVDKVRSLLISYGYPEANIKVGHRGEESPLNNNNNSEQKRRNRRVEVDWERAWKDKAEAMGDIQDLYKLLAQEKQVHCIDPRRDTMLGLEQGTVIFIPAGSFFAKPNECVTFKAKEIYKFSDMIMENLATTSNGSLLETGGMVYTEASDSEGNKLNLNPGKELTIYLPTDTLRRDMRLFYGDRDPHSNMNWTEGGTVDRFGVGVGMDERLCPDRDPPIACEKCPFLTCRLFGRMDDAFKGMGDKDVKAANKEFRDCQKRIRKSKRNAKTQPQLSDDCAALYDKYGVNTYEELLVKQFEETAQRLEDALEGNIEEGEASINDLKFYVLQTKRMGWINCDAFSSILETSKINMLVDTERNSETDCSIVFKNRKSMMKPDFGPSFKFSRIAAEIAIWILALKYHDNQVFISLKSDKTRIQSDKIEYKQVSLDELKVELEKLDM